MSDFTVTADQISSLADKLEGMGDQFSADELQTIKGVFYLAGSAIADEADVQGFAAVDMFSPTSMTINFAVNGDGSVKNSVNDGYRKAGLIGLLVPAVQKP